MRSRLQRGLRTASSSSRPGLRPAFALRRAALTVQKSFVRTNTSTSSTQTNIWGALWPTQQADTRTHSGENLAAAASPASTITLLRSSPAGLVGKGDHSIKALVLFVTQEQTKEQIPLNLSPGDADFDKLLPQPLVLPSACLEDFKGNEKDAHFIYPSWEGKGIIPRVLLVGLGKQDRVTVDTIRKATHAAVAKLRGLKIDHAAYLLPTLPGSTLARSDIVDAVSRTSVLSNHKFDKYLTGDNLPVPLKSLTLICENENAAQDAELAATIKTAQTVAECTVLARELANDRSDHINPKTLEALAKTVASTHKLKITTLSDSKLRGLGLNMLPSVGQAAVHPARLVVLEYEGNPDAPKEVTALVGKGITFDTGGLNLKPTGSMENMHMDMGGTAAVLGTIKAAAVLGLKVNVVAALALAENAIGKHAMKPHTVLKTAKGTVEVSNTDAEGRLALADAFTYVQKHHKPQAMIDVATLTGACVVALGEYTAGLFSNNDALAARLNASGARTFERCWRLPILPEHSEELKGTYSDMRSTGKDRWGGACTAAAFLQKFVDEGVHWAHLDIAGPGMYSQSRDFMCQGATGFGVQLLVDYLQQVSKAAPAAAAQAGGAGAAGK